MTPTRNHSSIERILRPRGRGQMAAASAPVRRSLGVSFVIPTLNSTRYLGTCLASIRAQDFDGSRIEILVVDGGSTDTTRAVATSYGARLLENSDRTAEAGKAIGARSASHELLAFVDSDNELIGNDWLKRMTAPFTDPTIAAAESLFWDVTSPRLSRIDRYCALMGMNDPLCLFLGNYGRFSYLAERWTGLPVRTVQRDGYLEMQPSHDAVMPTMGANGFIVRRDVLLSILRGPRMFDIDCACELGRLEDWHIARVPTSVAHYFASGLRDYARKTRRRAQDFHYFAARGERTYPWEELSRTRVAQFCAYTLLVVPTMVQAMRGFSHRPDTAWLIHPLACWITLGVYASETLRAWLRPPKVYDRSAWRQ